MNVVSHKRDYILPFKKYLNKPKKSVSFEQKVEYEFTYGRDAYDRKPIENVEQVTLRELYELTLSRIEARKSNVYYSNQAPKNNYPDISEYLNDDEITEENKMSIISMAEQEKINNMEVDELEDRTKNNKKIKLDFDKANIISNNNENSNDNDNQEEAETTEINDIPYSNQPVNETAETTEINDIPSSNQPVDEIDDNESDLIICSDDDDDDIEPATVIPMPQPQNPVTKNITINSETIDPSLNDPESLSPRCNPVPHLQNPLPRVPDIENYSESYDINIPPQNREIENYSESYNMNIPSQDGEINDYSESYNMNRLPQNGEMENYNEPFDMNRPPQGREVYLPNGEINYNNLPNNFVSPKRLDSRNRRVMNSGINCPLDLAHYKPPIKSLAEINDPDYEKNVGNEPVPYGSNVVYEEPDLLSPNLENAIPVYNRPKMNYRNNLINMTYNNSYPGYKNGQTENAASSPKMNATKTEAEKKKEKKNNRKSLSFLNILKKSKSAENMKSKGRMSIFSKPATKTNSVFTNNSDNKDESNSPSQKYHHSLNASTDSSDIKPLNTKNLNRVSIFNNFQEPTINDLIVEGPTNNNDIKPLSKYALKSLKIRQSDNSLHVNTNELLNVPGSPTNHNVISPLSVKSNQSSNSNSSHSNSSTTKPSINTYVPNIPLD